MWNIRLMPMICLLPYGVFVITLIRREIICFVKWDLRRKERQGTKRLQGPRQTDQTQIFGLHGF